ncbi:2-(1,2-epoxy-1,2-dihydrophenyl)acetyl-CoA isomerase [Erythrobacteraceae bacterium CFH 75059]|uniref:enoyl-CoA hydratase-related protein n=1 Tax=Qipengyuania thermophila TaxID=2509361 RepID=UPI00101FF4C9|nr:enoyl-CoA hydratase-related protein [Qipengyuania thermophila]TCD04293.1 2-(1,2-epoxy-1,2-dihydrophenyl)acetyl-CoA isomerase [Erythrobacteraceae bacterium CFH 75059]
MADMITTHRDGAVLAITLNRPERLNACPPQMADELRRALAGVGDARCVLLTGAGRAFCSGADLAAGAAGSEGGSGGTPGRHAHDRLNASYNPLMLALARCPVPVVAAVNGPAAGIGCSIALAADLVIAARSAYFLQAFVNIGLVPDGGASWMLPRLVGKARAMEMMLLGERIPAAQAVDWGLIARMVEDDELAAEAQRLAQRLAAGPTVALAAMRANVWRALDSDFATALGDEAEAQRVAGDSSDAAEGALAFLQKRAARFTGG